MPSQRFWGPFPVPILLLSLSAVCSSCSVKQASDEGVAECVGINCDAGADEIAEPAAVDQPYDGGPELQPVEAGVTLVCPGECMPDDPAECADFVPQSTALSAENQLSFAASGVADASTEEDEEGRPTADEEDVEATAESLGADLPTVGELLDASTSATEAALADGGVIEETAPVPGDSDDATDASIDREADVDEAGILVEAAAPPIDTVEAGEALAPPVQADEVTYSCQLLPQSGQLRASCAPEGTGETSDACTSGSDCMRGHACVAGSQGAITGQCQPYCCEGRSACGPNQICAERRLLAPGLEEGSELTVPVCIVPEQCDLTDPYPCPVGETCSCRPGLACSVVGRDGARACLEPGTGEEGDSCPCAAGFFCSPMQQQCLRQCQFGSDTCGEGTCQGVGGFPPEWGLCVGAIADP